LSIFVFWEKERDIYLISWKNKRYLAKSCTFRQFTGVERSPWSCKIAFKQFW